MSSAFESVPFDIKILPLVKVAVPGVSKVSVDHPQELLKRKEMCTQTA